MRRTRPPPRVRPLKEISVQIMANHTPWLISKLAGGVVSVAKAPYSSTAEGEALEEARLAAETIVLPLAQPAELLPRGEAVLRAQVRFSVTCGAAGLLVPLCCEESAARHVLQTCVHLYSSSRQCMRVCTCFSVEFSLSAALQPRMHAHIIAPCAERRLSS